MTTPQEIVDLADAMQLRGDERKEFIAEEMDKLRNLQAEERVRKDRLPAEEMGREREARLQAEERAARLQAEERERVARLQAEERAARLQAEERERVARLQAEERAARLQAEERERAARLQAEERAARLQAQEREKERAARLQAEERGRAARLQDEENEKERQARLKIEELKAQVEIEKICAQAGVKTVGGAAEGTTGIYADQVKPKLPKLPAIVDGKDDLDSWLLRFEGFANTSGWPKENWCTFLSALLTGRTLEVFCRLSESEAIVYDRVKEVLKKRHILTEDGYRQKFRAGTPEDGENPNMARDFPCYQYYVTWYCLPQDNAGTALLVV